MDDYKMENPIKMGWFGGYPYFWKHPAATSWWQHLASAMSCFPIWFASGVIQCALALVSHNEISEINKAYAFNFKHFKIDLYWFYEYRHI